GPPAGADTAAFRTRPWRPSRIIADRDTIDLGGRVLEIFHVPGHTPDALALFDRTDGLLFTGDSYYDGAVWLYVPETDLDGYDRSMTRLAELGPKVKHLLPAHNTASADPARLFQVRDAVRRVRSGELTGLDQGSNRVLFSFEGFSVLTSRPLLDHATGDR